MTFICTCTRLVFTIKECYLYILEIFKMLNISNFPLIFFGEKLGCIPIIHQESVYQIEQPLNNLSLKALICHFLDNPSMFVFAWV